MAFLKISFIFIAAAFPLKIVHTGEYAGFQGDLGLAFNIFLMEEINRTGVDLNGSALLLPARSDTDWPGLREIFNGFADMICRKIFQIFQGIAPAYFSR